jgi:hypothetical protein
VLAILIKSENKKPGGGAGPVVKLRPVTAQNTESGHF